MTQILHTPPAAVKDFSCTNLKRRQSQTSSSNDLLPCKRVIGKSPESVDVLVYFRYHIRVICAEGVSMNLLGKIAREKDRGSLFPTYLRMPHLLLQLEDAIHERFTRGRAAGDVDVDGHDAITAAGDAVTVVVVPATVGAAAHADNPPRIGHLVVHHAQRGGHLVRQCPRHDHHVRLSWRGSKDDPQSVLVIARGGQVHHFHGAAGQAEGQGPQ